MSDERNKMQDALTLVNDVHHVILSKPLENMVLLAQKNLNSFVVTQTGKDKDNERDMQTHTITH